MNEISQNWNWFDVFKAVAGPVIAAVFVVVGIWLKERYDRRKAVQSWFEQYYITEGLDVLISYVEALRAELVNVRFPLFTRPASPGKLPFEVATRIQTLLNKNSFSSAYNILLSSTQFVIDAVESRGIAELSELEGRRVNALSSAVTKLSENLQAIRKQLLQVRVKNKSEVYRIAGNGRVASLIKASHDDLINGMQGVRDIYSSEATGVTSLTK